MCHYLRLRAFNLGKMKKHLYYTFFLIVSMEHTFLSLRADTYPRNSNIDVTKYTFRLELCDTTDTIIGDATIQIDFQADSIHEFFLDFEGISSHSMKKGMVIDSLFENGHSIQYGHKNGRIRLFLHTGSRKHETRLYRIYYHGVPEEGFIISKTCYGDRSFFADNWPDRAHFWLPCIDHPSDKADCEWIITAPSHYQVVASGQLMEKSDLRSGLRLTRYLTIAPVPTKVLALGIARFAVEYYDNAQGLSIQSWVYPQDREAGFRDFSLARPIVTFFQNQIGPFPFAKLANVQSKTSWGGLENAGAIFYYENAITGKCDNENLIAHEIAHQWFGDAVTEADWNHIWLSEGFATYMTHIYTEFTYGRDRMIQGMINDRERIYNYSQEHPFSPIVDTTTTDLYALLNPNSYEKGSWVLHMLRHQTGEENFWNGIREYYEQFRNRNVMTEDFQKIMESVSGKNLSAFFKQWIYTPGYPRIEGSWNYDQTKKEIRMTLRQTQHEFGIFTMDLEIGIDSQTKHNLYIVQVTMSKKVETFRIPAVNQPSNIIPDPNTWSLGKFTLQKK
jgi:aminopeptidase N